jgi:serine phosphatase RsbU (regulator of sigma subunit)
MTSGALNYKDATRGSSPRGLLSTPTARAGLAAAVIFVAFTAVLLSGRLDPATLETVTDFTFIALGLVYVPLAARRARAAQGRLKTAWTAMTIGFAFWLLGEVLWAYYRLVADQTPFPSWADAAYLAYVPWVCLALLLFPTARSWRSQAQTILDGIIVTGSFFLISWLTAMRSVWQSVEGNTLGFAVSVGYPAGDVLVMTIGLLVLIRAAPGLRRTLTLLVVGLMAAALADSLWIYESNTSGYSAGSLIDILYLANSLLIIVALVAGYHAEPGDPAMLAPPNWLVRSLPLVPLAVAAIFVARADTAVLMEPPAVITGLLLIAGLLLREILEAAELGTRERQVRTLADQLAGELDSAAKYVASILPGDLTGRVQARSRYLPSRALGGDSYGYTWIDDDHLIVYLIDVSGHGVKPALLSVSVHNMLRSRSMPAATLLSPERVLAELNQLFGMDRHDDHYFTMWYGVYRASTRTLHYAAAGHPPALALTDADGVVNATALGGTSIPIGMFPDSVFPGDTYRIPAGAQLLLCSDGVLGDRLSFAGFTEVCEEVAAAPGWSPASLIARLRATAGGTFEDDCALVQLTF